MTQAQPIRVLPRPGMGQSLPRQMESQVSRACSGRGTGSTWSGVAGSRPSPNHIENPLMRDG